MHIDKKITDRYNIFKKLCCGNFRRGDTNGLDLTPGNNTGTRNIADAVTLEAENASVYFGSNNRMFWYSTAVNPVTAQRNANKTAILNMEALNAQFMDNEGKLVDYLRDYDVYLHAVFDTKKRSRFWSKMSKNGLIALVFHGFAWSSRRAAKALFLYEGFA